MITALIGKSFLKAFNEKFNKSLSARDFLREEYFELFFNHPKYMQWVTNSPFVQMKSGQKPHLLTVDERLEKLENLYYKVENESPDASFALGYPASEADEFANTSGLVTDIVVESEEEDIFYSWIGSGLGIGVAGGYNLLIDDAELLLLVFEGWKYYRKYLNDPTLKQLKEYKINSWNGQWLTYRLGKNYREDFDFLTLQNEGVFAPSRDSIEIAMISWSNLFFSLSRFYPDKNLASYIYSLGEQIKPLGLFLFI